MEKVFMLCLDVSTTCVGIALFDYNNEKVLELKQIEPKVKNATNDSLLYEKANLVQTLIEEYKGMPIKHIWIEEPLLGSNNVYTVATLLKFNGIISKMCYDILGVAPKYISSYDSRAKAFPNLMQVGSAKNKLVLFGAYKKKADSIDEIKEEHRHYYKVDKEGYATLDKKKVIFDEVNKLYPKLEWLKDTKGRLKKSNYDIADSITCGIAVLNQKNK
jgi:hypothetical protein